MAGWPEQVGRSGTGRHEATCHPRLGGACEARAVRGRAGGGRRCRPGPPEPRPQAWMARTKGPNRPGGGLRLKGYQGGDCLLDSGQSRGVVRLSLNGRKDVRKSRGHVHSATCQKGAEGRRDIVNGLQEIVIHPAQLGLQGVKRRLDQGQGRLLVGKAVGKGRTDQGQLGFQTGSETLYGRFDGR